MAEILRRLLFFLPSGGTLPEDVWRKRHRFLSGLTWFHALIIALAGPVLGYTWDLSPGALFREGTVLHPVGEGLIVAVFAALAYCKGFTRAFQATAIAFGLMSSSAILVHLSGGYIELHFHFFVMIVFLALYQDWIPYSLAIVYVALHHGVVGVLWPEDVYNHAAAFNAPWTWAGIHAFFVLWASVGSIIAWRFNETAFARTKLILNSAGEGIYGLDLRGRATFVNPAAARMLGYEGEELIGRTMHDVLHHTRANGSLYPSEECPIYAAFRDGEVRRVAGEVFWRKNGTSFPVDYVSTPILERGQVTGAVVTFQDVTGRTRAEEAIRALNRELERRVIERTAELEATNARLQEAMGRAEEASRHKSEFLAHMSHELRTPLNAILGFSQVLETRSAGALTEKQARFVNHILTGGRHLLTLIDGILDLTKVEAGRLDLRPESLTLSEALAEALSVLRPQAEAKGLQVQLDTDGTPSRLTADPVRFKQILYNLLSNAVKFTPAGGCITLRARADAEAVELSVADTGIGIKAEDQLKLFQPFTQLEPAAAKFYPGSGLGLALTRKIVELHGGTIQVASEGPGRGTTFTVRLPIAPLVGATSRR